jgi:uncharacterized OB-fold protein
MKKEEPELLTIHTAEDAEMPFAYSAGYYKSKFLAVLRDEKKIIGIRCPSCQRVYTPPRKICGHCFVEMDERVEVGPKGTVNTYTIVRFPFVDPESGEIRPTPYAYGFIQPDGADTILPHYIKYENESDVKVGIRVEAVFRNDRTGDYRDIMHFRILDE